MATICRAGRRRVEREEGENAILLRLAPVRAPVRRLRDTPCVASVLVFVLASGGWCLLRKWCGLVCVFAGIRDALARFTRRPCAGRHLLFFAAAKKSRQKKAAHTASPASYPRAPNVPTLHTATPLFACVANASNQRLTRFEYPYSGKRQRTIYAAQVANCA
jgi:hypothetical protein